MRFILVLPYDDTIFGELGCSAHLGASGNLECVKRLATS